MKPAAAPAFGAGVFLLCVGFLTAGSGGCAGDMRLVSPGAPGASATAPSPNDLLVVITYGKGCSAQSWGNGLRDVAAAIRQRFPTQRVITRGWDDQDGIEQTINDHPGPVALVGHSFGGCRSVEIAGRVKHPIEWMVLLDPVPCDAWMFSAPGQYFRIPANVRQAVCYYQPLSLLPASRPIANPTAAYANRPRFMGHSDFCHSQEIHRYVLEACGRTSASLTATAAALVTSSAGAVPDPAPVLK